jgi:hypothetical protein
VDKHDYIVRLGRFAQRHDGELAHSESGNMPGWAQADSRVFWVKTDEHERANATLYHEVEFALPMELSHAQQIECAREFVRQICGEQHPYSWGLHAKEGNPHVHLMFSGRMLDGIERDAEQFFKRYNSKNPERGGCRKEASGDARGREWVKQIRADWQDVANRYLAAAGQDARIDHRSNKDRGLKTAPGIHLGRKAHRLEKSGRKSLRGLRNKERSDLNASFQKTKDGVRAMRRERAGRNANSCRNESGQVGRLSKSPVAAMKAETRRGRTLYRWAHGAAAGLPAIVDRGDQLSLVGKASHPKARALIELAKAKGWASLVLTGSDEFKRLAVREALRAGVRIANPELASIVEEEKNLMSKQTNDQARDELARQWLATAAPVDAIEAAKLKNDPERLRQRFENHPDARRWELIQQQRAEGVPEPLLGFRIERDTQGVTNGTVRHVGKHAWIEPHDQPGVVVPVTTSRPVRPGQQVAVHRNGEITPLPDRENTLKPR